MIYIHQLLAMPIFCLTSLRFEFQGENVLKELHYSNMIEFLLNIFAIVAIVRYHKLTITKEAEQGKVKVG